MRVKIIKFIADCERKDEPCYINVIAEKLGMSHVAIKKHVDLMVGEKYVSIVNPGGKPHFLVLTEAGIEILNEFTKKNK